MKKINFLFTTCTLCAIVLSIGSCYYDKEEILYPNTICDTATITFSASVQPVLSAYCLSCHAGSTPSAGINLETYDAVRIQAANGRLLGVVTHSNNYSPMPKNSSKLSDCNITKIRQWIEDGYPNN